VAVSTRATTVGGSLRRPTGWSPAQTGAITIAIVVLAGLLVARTPSPQLAPLPSAARGLLAGLVLFLVCGDAVAVALVPREWGHRGGCSRSRLAPRSAAWC
jgi:hypothetical protein